MEVLTKSIEIISASSCSILPFGITLIGGYFRDSYTRILSCKKRQKAGLATTFTMAVSVLSFEAM